MRVCECVCLSVCVQDNLKFNNVILYKTRENNLVYCLELYLWEIAKKVKVLMSDVFF